MPELHPLITDLAFILAITSIFSLLFKWLNQPVVLAYITVGIILSLFIHNKQEMYTHIKVWADIGIIFLLFGLGLEFSFKKLKKVGLSASVASVTIVISMMGLGYLAGSCFGWSHITSLFLGAMLCMSSTMIIIKIFDDYHLNKKKFTEIVWGILVIEDLIAIVLMVLFSTIAISRKFEGQELILGLTKLSTFLLFWFVLGIYFIPLTLQKTKRFLNDEVLLILAVALCLGMVFLATKAGYSSALGAFVMGSILAETIEGERIERILLPIKNFFGVLFFVSVGMLVNINTFTGIHNITSIGIVSLIVIMGQILFATIGTLLSGQNLKTAVFTGFSLAQIGEFSYIIGSLGLSLGVIEQSLYQVVVATSIVTIFVTPFTMKLAPITYNFLKEKLPPKWVHHFNKNLFDSSLIKDENLWRKLLNNMAMTTGIYFFLAFTIVFFLLKYGNLIIQNYLPGFKGNLLCSSLAILLISPFLWMIIFRDRNSPEFIQLWNENEENKIRLTFTTALQIIICTGLIMCILIRLLKLHSINAFIITLAILTTFLTSKKLQKHSNILERRFIDNLNAKEKYKESKTIAISKDFTNNLMEQDLHLSDFKVEYNYSIVGKTLKELNFRQHFGVNVVIILRGNQKINIPRGQERLYPKDHLIVFGTDKQMEVFQTKLEEESTQMYPQYDNEEKLNTDIVLQQFEVRSDSQLIGQTILSSQIQEKYHCLLVGIERNNTSTLKLDLTIPFEKGDILWIAGEHNGIKKLKNL